MATPVWVATDTHIHTREVSGHGDASLEERALSLAGEGVELAVATEHDRPTDHVQRGHRRQPWPAALVHGDGSRQLRRDAVRLVEPIRSWFTVLNRGRRVTPIGASDSHDVSRFIVGQGRTYVRVADGDAGRIPVDAAVDGLRAGRVIVSLGLFAEARIGNAQPGDLVPAARASAIEADVRGPTWIPADRVSLWVNGAEAASAPIVGTMQTRVRKASARWPLPARRHDYVVIASGPGVTDPSWAIAVPYQPTSPKRAPVVFALTAPIYVDADGDDRLSSARDYGRRLAVESSHSVPLAFAIPGIAASQHYPYKCEQAPPPSGSGACSMSLSVSA